LSKIDIITSVAWFRIPALICILMLSPLTFGFSYLGAHQQ
jgi:hypothetical protein